MAGNDCVNLFDLTYDAINAIKKKELVSYIEKMKVQVVANNHIQNLCSEIANLLDDAKSLVSTNEEIISELVLVKNVNNILKNRIVNLKKQLSKSEKCGRRNNVEISGVSYEIEENIIKICKVSDTNISHMDIEGCLRLPLGGNATNTTKQQKELL